MFFLFSLKQVNEEKPAKRDREKERQDNKMKKRNHETPTAKSNERVGCENSNANG